MNPDADAKEVCDLLTDQKVLLWRIHHGATEPPGKVMAKADLANFLLCHGLHIHELAKAALLLMENREPYAVVLLGRSALESAFNLVAAKNDVQFGPQRMAHELEDLARKLKLLAEHGAWPATRKPTREDCLRESERIRQSYNAPAPTKEADKRRVKLIEEIAKVADLSPYYEDDYRQLSLTVHSNQAGILNAGSGFLVRKGMLAVCNAALLASATLCDAFRLRTTFNDELEAHEARLAKVMQRPDHLPQSPNIFGNPGSPADHNRSHGIP
jgi:hypothetical protein